MHRRRVTDAMLKGEERALICVECYEAYRRRDPVLSKYALSNYLWLGRHPPLLRDARMGHQLLLALGRVVSTKVYLSSKGVDETSR